MEVNGKSWFLHEFERSGVPLAGLVWGMFCGKFCSWSVLVGGAR